MLHWLGNKPLGGLPFVVAEAQAGVQDFAVVAWAGEFAEVEEQAEVQRVAEVAVQVGVVVQAGVALQAEGLVVAEHFANYVADRAYVCPLPELVYV